MASLIKGLEEKRVKEMFGSGTACVVCPVNQILYQGKVSGMWPFGLLKTWPIIPEVYVMGVRGLDPRC